jgi:hypothetical protein
MRALDYGYLLIRVKLVSGLYLRQTWPGLDGFKFVDNHLQFPRNAPTFALYPQKLGLKRLKFYFRPQAVDNPVDMSNFGYLWF